MSDELKNEPALDERLIYLWALYLDVKSGCKDVTRSALVSYTVINGVEFTPWESSVMLDIDKLRVSSG